MLWIVLGVVCLVYYGFVTFAAEGQAFTWVWLILAAVFFGMFLKKRYRMRHPAKKKPPLWWKTFCVTTGILTAILLGVTLSRITASMLASPQEGLEYIVILSEDDIAGEGQKELARRLDRAVEYLKANPQTNVIVSGGWSDSQGYSKAHVMYQYLLRQGIATDRIFWETHSQDSRQNLRNSMLIAGGRGASLGIVSSDYFAYRAGRIARSLGMYQTQKIPADTTLWLLPHRLAEELLLVLRDKFLGI